MIADGMTKMNEFLLIWSVQSGRDFCDLQKKCIVGSEGAKVNNEGDVNLYRKNHGCDTVWACEIV